MRQDQLKTMIRFLSGVECPKRSYLLERILLREYDVISKVSQTDLTDHYTYRKHDDEYCQAYYTIKDKINREEIIKQSYL